jgi:hypothetical protein
MAAKAETGAGGAVSRDMARKDGRPPNAGELLVHAARKSGRGVFELTREWRRLKRGPGKLTLGEYVQFGLQDSARYSPEEKARFITNTLHWPIVHQCCDMTWQATTEDKWLCSHILRDTTITIPQTLAVIDRSGRTYPGTRKIGTPEALRDFLASGVTLPIFGKVNRGIVSAGVFLVEAADADGLELSGEGRMSYDAFWREFLAEEAYILQPVMKNHSFFDRYTPSLATVRTVILVTPQEVRIPIAVLKLPARANIADSFWRPGNVACGINVATGQIETAKTKSPFETTDHEDFPETGARLVGEVLPHWEAVLRLARETAAVFAPVRYQSMDIAIAEDGPVLIEVNTGGGFDLPQLATGRGMLTEEITGFFESCGWKFR